MRPLNPLWPRPAHQHSRLPRTAKRRTTLKSRMQAAACQHPTVRLRSRVLPGTVPERRNLHPAAAVRPVLVPPPLQAGPPPHLAAQAGVQAKIRQPLPALPRFRRLRPLRPTSLTAQPPLAVVRRESRVPTPWIRSSSRLPAGPMPYLFPTGTAHRAVISRQPRGRTKCRSLPLPPCSASACSASPWDAAAALDFLLHGNCAGSISTQTRGGECGDRFQRVSA